MTNPSEPTPRRIRTTERKGPQMLSIFCPTEVIVPAQQQDGMQARRKRRPSLITDAHPPLAPGLNSPSTNPQARDILNHQALDQQEYFVEDVHNRQSPSLEEVEITGLELLRRSDHCNDDSFSYESYALDSFALVGKKSLNSIAFCNLQLGEVRTRSSVECSSLGSGFDASGSFDNHGTPQPLSRRCSNESNNTSLWDSEDDYGYGRQRHAGRQGSVGSFANDSLERVRCKSKSVKPPLSSDLRCVRRSSTGTNDLPGFGRYKARRASLSNINERRRCSTGSFHPNSVQQRFEAILKKCASTTSSGVGIESAVLGPSSDSLPRRLSMGSRSSGFSSGARPRH